MNELLEAAAEAIHEWRINYGFVVGDGLPLHDGEVAELNAALSEVVLREIAEASE